MFDLLVVLGAFGSQFFLSPKWVNGDELWVFYWLTLVIVGAFFEKGKREVSVRWFGAITLVSLISVFCNFFVPQQPIYIQVFLKVLIGCLAIRMIAERLTISDKDIGNWLLLLWIINHGILILQKFGMIFEGYQLSGFYTMPWMMGCAAVLSIPFMRKLKKWYSAILILPILFSHSIAIVALGILMFFQPKLKHALFAILAVTLYMFFVDSGIDFERFIVIKNSMKYWDNLFFGDGIGAWAHHGFTRLNGSDPYWWRWAHNELYQWCTETGIVGGAIILGLFRDMFIHANLEKKYHVAGIFLLAMVHPIFHIPRLIPFLILFFSEAVRRRNLEC